MSEFEPADRMANIRARFSLELIAGIEEAAQNLCKLLGSSRAAADATAETYLRFREIRVAGPTVGFAETARAARPLDAVLAEAWRTQRGLTEAEAAKAREGLEHVRAAILAENGGANALTA